MVEKIKLVKIRKTLAINAYLTMAVEDCGQNGVYVHLKGMEPQISDFSFEETIKIVSLLENL